MADLYRVRWMIRRDMPEVYGIENANFEHPWSEDDFIRCLRQRNCIGLVVEHNARVLGFTIYELHPKRIDILNLAVHAAWHRKGVGRKLIDKLLAKLRIRSDGTSRNCITLAVRESNLIACQFFRAMGFRAVAVLHDYFEDTDEDAILFEYRKEAAVNA